jgi:hypothetical protein
MVRLFALIWMGLWLCRAFCKTNPMEIAKKGSKSTLQSSTTVPYAGPPTSVAIPPPIQQAFDFGPNVLIFDPTMPSATIQSQIDHVFYIQQSNEFGAERYAILFKPGCYSLNIQIGFYTTILGLGNTPDSVTIKGGINALAAWFDDNATQNFWRGIENLAIIPTVFSNNTIWATSQGTWLRRVHIQGQLFLFDFISKGPNNFASGGFIADSIVDIGVESGSQQQYFSRNTKLKNWQGGVWNMVFVGDLNTPNGTWPKMPFTIIQNTPVVREKPYLTIDSSSNYFVVVPCVKINSRGPSWSINRTIDDSISIPLSEFYIAKANFDTALTINIALQQGLHLLFTPGIYKLSQPIVVRNANTIVLGLGLATLQPTCDSPVIIVADVPGVTIAGLLLDAGPALSPNLMQIGGSTTSKIDHSINPTAIFDVSCRIGGATPHAQSTSCLVINSNNVLIDNIWLWRADHGVQPNYTGWTINPSSNGLIVNSNDVTAYGLFVEHFQNFQTLWNGNNGKVYFYQSECPYDVPNQSSWKQNGENGYSSYKVGNFVTSHIGEGIGIYSNFDNFVKLNNAIETPSGKGIKMNHLVTVWLSGANGSSINHIINGMGRAVTSSSTLSQSEN